MEKQKIDNSKRTPVRVATRAMGYVSFIDNFNPGKKSEYDHRKYFKEPV